MALYDWLLNSLRNGESAASNQLPTPIQSANLSALPVPFQNMPSESSSFNPFLKVMNIFSSKKPNANIAQDSGTSPPDNPLRTAIIQQYMTGLPMAKNMISAMMPASQNGAAAPASPAAAPVPSMTPNFLGGGDAGATSSAPLRMQMVNDHLANNSPNGFVQQDGNYGNNILAMKRKQAMSDDLMPGYDPVSYDNIYAPMV